VSVQVASSVLAERLPVMCGSETLTTVVSSTSMKVLDMTAMAISQGLISLENRANLASYPVHQNLRQIVRG
jgi:hypothetical protein